MLGSWAPGVSLVLVGPMLMAQLSAPLVVPQGEVVSVRLLQQISSGTGVAGDTVKMQAFADLIVDGRVVVYKGAPVTATVAVAKKKAKRGSGARVSIHITDVEMADGERLALNTTEASSGGGPNEKVYAGLVVASILLLSPAGTVTALLLHGQEVVLPVGTELEARAAEATTLDPVKFELAEGVSGDSAHRGSEKAEQTVTLGVETNAGDGSMWVDGQFRGETPTKIDLKRGLHTVKVIRSGFKTWQEKVVVEGDSLMLTLALQKKK
jgi:hypothetical protein